MFAPQAAPQARLACLRWCFMMLRSPMHTPTADFPPLSPTASGGMELLDLGLLAEIASSASESIAVSRSSRQAPKLLHEIVDWSKSSDGRGSRQLGLFPTVAGKLSACA